MSHLDPEQIALLALGEAAASLADCAHLRECEICAAEIDELKVTVEVARTTAADVGLESPPDRVWDAIAAEVGLGSAASAAGAAVADAAFPPPHGTPSSLSGSAPQDDADTDTDAAPGDPRDAAPAPSAYRDTGAAVSDRPAAGRTGRRARGLFALAASLALVAGVGIGAWVINAVNQPTTVAQAALDPFPDHPDAAGVADVEVARDGSRALVVSVEGGVVADTYREVWLIRNDAGALISLGVLDGDSGTFAVPDGVDLDEYSLVDVSVEPIDGDPAHSGDSIVRGELTGL
ncbi:hypothetical protein JOD63_002461 [Microbacterium terrae]|uniref:Anti-sigma-K factor rskA n=1 Tax=Microbacterium terrae TaxID=69369 RepID=A0A0M2H9N7_9MICO|nr:anti-sigma factor [Microbacterium terrae]KJL43302.1 Anti-sigma-K factor rskA [Microbacterium terrae]MBP1078493.1 hypothetical protein [Microbacterium terrae]GLJ97894.1 hypothetical protein GCM10017594_10910 [Microbacterium terrae]